MKLLSVLVFCFAIPFSFSNPIENVFCETNGPKAEFYTLTKTAKDNITDASTLNSSATTFFIIHGWIEDSTHAEYERIARELSEETGGNAILVDYKELAYKFYLTCAWYIVTQIGELLTEFIVNGTRANFIHPSRIHIIGHSLGGQISGYVGRNVYEKTGFKIKRISGLDPAGPLFTVGVWPLPNALSKEDAEIVDVLHTSIVFGSIARIGNIDVYARGVLGLPTLPASCINSVEYFCSHWLSKSLFRESISSCGIVAENVEDKNDKVVYGLHMPLEATGIYEFYPNAEEPYGSADPNC